ncbi:general odorant-binding protein 67-like [Anopheles cruzii]|uniref:general odorant-binding protein 67-like n=1 Tax=Anopheles cruzii TaxID=68878 RepID=UPI0022EC5A20|nr:general odorant-binding protein 67-like [Anopheles cruzii]
MASGTRFELLRLVTMLFVICGQLNSLTEAATAIDCNFPPLEVHPKDCCQLPSLIDEDLLQHCKALYGGEPLQRKLIYERGKCFIECALNATGTMVNGQLDQGRIMGLIESGTRDDPVVMQLLQANTMACLQQWVAPLATPTTVGCGSQGVDFVGCVNIQNFLNCPLARWTNSDECNSLKQFISLCPRPL